MNKQSVYRFRPTVESLEARCLLAADAIGVQVADFSLLDTNPTSLTYNQRVSPRDTLGQVTGWYFGHAT